MHVSRLFSILVYLTGMPMAISALDDEHIVGAEVSLDITTDQLSRRQLEDPLVLVRREDGGYDIFSSSQVAELGIDPRAAAKQDLRHSMNKRSSWPADVCKQFGDRNSPCWYRTESAKCISETEYQLYCAGCFNLRGDRSKQEVPKQSCHANQICVDTRATNAWGEDSEYVACIPKSQTTEWNADTDNAQDTKTCSPGLTNRLGRTANVELKVVSQNRDPQFPSESHKYLVTPKSISLVLNGKELEHVDGYATLDTDVSLRSGSTVQGCLTTIGRAKQLLAGRLGLIFLPDK